MQEKKEEEEKERRKKEEEEEEGKERRHEVERRKIWGWVWGKLEAGNGSECDKICCVNT